jgi:hypothetical protein
MSAVSHASHVTPVTVDEALAACLAILEIDSEHYRRAAASWHARWCGELTTFTVAERRTTMTLLDAIAGPRGIDAARTLRFLCLMHDERGIAAVLERWIDGRR